MSPAAVTPTGPCQSGTVGSKNFQRPSSPKVPEECAAAACAPRVAFDAGRRKLQLNSDFPLARFEMVELGGGIGTFGCRPKAFLSDKLNLNIQKSQTILLFYSKSLLFRG
ncbi:unnamed protein product [Victoria cruziana]